MGAQPIIEMEGKKTRIVNIKVMQNHKYYFIVILKACCNFMKLVSCGVREYENTYDDGTGLLHVT